MKYAFKMMAVLWALILLQGCYVAGGSNKYKNSVVNKNTTPKANVITSSFNAKKSKPIVKRPRTGPYDWNEKDSINRKIWFEETNKEYKYCDGFAGNFKKKYEYYDTSKREIVSKKNYVLPHSFVEVKKTFLYNGNIIHTFYVPETVKEVLKINSKPEGSLVKIIGIQGLKPNKKITFEVKENIRYLNFQFVESSGLKPVLSKCSISFSKSNKSKYKKYEFEKARGDALKRLAREQKIAPVLQASEKEKIKPVITLNVFPKKTDSLNFFLRGSIKDDSGVATLLVQKQKAKVSADGRFAHRLKLGYGTNKIKIQAEDVNGNISEKTIIVIREEYISEQTLADVDLPPKTRMSNPDALAVVIGVENYQYVPDATYAYNDAEVFREYLSETLGFKKQRIKIATNSKATQAELNKLLGSNGWLSRNIVKGKSDVVVYFSGHGIANSKDNKTGILPFDVDPNYAIGLPLKELYYNLSKMGARTVTVYLDACFTGQTRDSKMLIADARPIIISPNKDSVPSNVTVFSASTGSQISGAIKEKEHGLFTYYLLKGMSGDADTNKDKSIQINELSSYVSKNVKDQAAINGREQTPELQGDKERVLVQFN